MSTREFSPSWSILHVVRKILAILCTSIFFFMTLTTYFRSSDLYNDMVGVTQAASTIHRSILPFVDYTMVGQVYGQPFISDRYDLSSTGVSVQLKLQAMTDVLNKANSSGSSLFFATSWGYPALRLNATSINLLCTQSLQSNMTVRLNNTKTAIAMKKNIKGYQASDWTGIDDTPLTIKATTDVAELTVVPKLETCIYQLRLRHLEAFELFDSTTATFNVMEAYFTGNGTPMSTVEWHFNAREHRFNWFYYYGRLEQNNSLALVCQVIGLLLIGLANKRLITFAYEAVEAGLKQIETKNKTLFSQVVHRMMNIKQSSKIQIESSFNRSSHSNPFHVDEIYYNSILVNVIQVYILYSKRFILFRTVNALDFFLTANWGFDHTMMNLQYINIMSGIFWFVLLTQKIASSFLYIVIVIISKAMKRKSSRSIKNVVQVQKPVDQPLLIKRRIPWLSILCKEVFRPNPELIVFIMFCFPKFFYAGFYGGATKWVPMEQSNLSALASNLGGSLLIFNLIQCSLCILPLNGLYLLCFPRSLSNGFIQSRLPGKVYSGTYYIFQDQQTTSLTFQGYKISSIVSMLYITWQQGLFKTKASIRTGYALSAHQFLHDSLCSEIELFHNLVQPIELTEVYETIVQHPEKQEAPPSSWIQQAHEHATSCAQLDCYKGRGWLLTWPCVANTKTTAPTNDAFVNMFRKRIIIMDNVHTNDEKTLR